MTPLLLDGCSLLYNELEKLLKEGLVLPPLLFVLFRIIKITCVMCVESIERLLVVVEL